jgi:hypothetical protein
LAISGVSTDDNITDAVLQKGDREQGGDKYTEETVPMKPLVTYSQAQVAVQELTNFSEDSKTMDNSTFNALRVIKRNLRNIKVKSNKQCSILNYISNKQGSNLYIHISIL